MKNFESGWARVKQDADFYRGRVARVVEDDGQWVTLSIDGDEHIFDIDHVEPCAAPKARPRG